ncbi:MAG: YicC/YloC family endoribonuclease, partial [Planctomycetota bacterium]|nr:YicC/YloC family endoribonuclease [Planctomycetota bacterium]
MNSMTGFGEATGRLSNKHIRGAAGATQCEQNIQVQIRSVNNKFLSIKSNLSEMLSGYESDIETIIRQYVQRGTVNLSIKVTPDRVENLVINRALLNNYYRQLKAIQKSIGLTGHLSFETLINLPGVLEPSTKSDYSGIREWRFISATIKRALENLVAMRRREGNRLKKTFQHNLKRMNLSLEGIKKRTPEVLSAYESSFRKKLQNIL